MSLTVSEEEIKHVKSGTALRFTVTVFADAAKTIGIGAKGFMAFRCSDGSLEIKPPVSYFNLYGKRIKFHGTSITPEASKAIEAYIEQQWGKKVAEHPDWNQERKAAGKRQKDEGWMV